MSLIISVENRESIMEGVIFIGLQASGKSTFFLQEFYKTHIRLNLDMLKTRNRERILLEACIAAKQSVVIDNTNPTRLERTKYIQQFKDNYFTVKGYYFSSSLPDCLARNANRMGKEQIPERGIKGTYNKLELPNYEEGFDQLYYVSLVKDKCVVEEWNHEI
ncbi:AAA family ATPase [Spartinivicinus poritis]|uniref:ATP-binding protein n=1 Tax=Spartinivicinus poritis TaxID=2994640 RepID=A0ABT5UHX3_9GAMM|nr:AAA family ATPase [Spartinivicinus sp. A2-2]MDE1465984.1 ATP-binding protein [Spartinivicinus sp. A2-2]